MKVSDKEKLIRKSWCHSASVYLQSDDEIEKTKVNFCLPEEFFRFSVFKSETYTDNNINNWWTNLEIIKILNKYENRIFEYKEWGFDGSHLIAKYN